MMEVIRESCPSDIAELGRLFFAVFGSKRHEALWRWKYFDNPRGLRSYCCEVDGRIVAHCGGTEVVFGADGGTWRALQSVDFMSSQEHPGGLGRGGVFARVVSAFFERYCGPGSDRVQMVYGFPGERHRVLGERVLGYRPVERVAELLVPAEGDRSFESLEVFGEGHFARLAQPVEGVGARRDATYLRWRYVDHPEHDYRILQEGETSAIVRDTGDGLFVMEVGGVTDGARARTLIAALRALNRPVCFWGSPAHPVGRRFVEAGCEFRERDHFVECRFFDDRVRPAVGEMYYTVGDYDVY